MGARGVIFPGELNNYVTVGTKTANSLDSFIITTDPTNLEPIITSFTPNVGAFGTAVTVTGNYFDTTDVNNSVKFNNSQFATVSASTKTQINTFVAEGATSGKISVRTPYGVAVSTADFFIPPNNVAAIGSTGNLTVDGSPLTISTGTTAGNAAMILFEGIQGQKLGLGVSPVAGQITMRIFLPQGTADLMTIPTFTAPTTVDLPTLPTTGTYIVLLTPLATSTASATLTLSNDITGSLEVNGTPVKFTTARPGQNARYTFNATSGQYLHMVVTNNTFTTNTRFYIYNPDGTQHLTGSFGNNSVTDMPVLNQTGTYTLFISSAFNSVGSFDVKLNSDVVNNITIDGTPAPQIDLKQGQNGRYSFNGNAGQGIGIGLTGLTLTPSSTIAITLQKPDGTTSSCTNTISASTSCDLPLLTALGSYTLWIDPKGISTANFGLFLSSDITGNLTIGGTAATFTTARPGQNARYKFQGLVNQIVKIQMSGNTFPGNTYFYLEKPDGTRNSIYLTGASSIGTFPALLATGNYSILVTPSGIATGTMQISLQ